ncbi:hypothetical protein A2960_00770 [Candidatus Gottesmanbacteria bacterium RIFCSPLOWO2_01_FULL_39_12b]|uniref:Glycosyl transferase family 1 domain-containing protein n=1 Tax=Candidatus Gottesmanbacteria bacterium RIFCSPLOWO2_01_FULL_39_12b TaxID=1798388 RepID=A0A1F6APT5_9BACT|nr:MAG: hypothetical protein A2960_00770 [Candidatus Gottesmanbacteria bacterium RIFCSPLOWO2_01_FULL_39_12b]
MKIGIDISMLAYTGSGVATYTYNLAKNLLIYDKKNEYILFYSSFRKPRGFYYLIELERLGGKIINLILPHTFLKLCWNKFSLLPVERFIGKVDVFHSSDYLRPPLFKNTLGITTIHDLTWKIFPEFHTKEIIEAHENKLEKTVIFGDIIIVDSYNTKKDLIKYYPQLHPKNIFVIYPGVDNKFKPIKDEQLVKKKLTKYGIDTRNRFLLYVGAIEPRKNLVTAIKLYYELIKDRSYSDFNFIIVGRAGWKNEEVFQTINNLKLTDKVKIIGFVEDQDLPYIYNAAQVFIYLSKYEGFGLPPLEAGKCGIPSLIYLNSSLQEIFPSDYPFAQKGSELETLIDLIKIRYKPYQKHLEKFSWKSYCDIYLDIVKSH